MTDEGEANAAFIVEAVAALTRSAPSSPALDPVEACAKVVREGWHSNDFALRDQLLEAIRALIGQPSPTLKCKSCDGDGIKVVGPGSVASCPVCQGSGEAVAESNGHHWVQRFNLTCCRDCGIVRRADDKNSPCKGVVRVGPRALIGQPAPSSTVRELLTTEEILNAINDRSPRARTIIESLSMKFNVRSRAALPPNAGSRK